MYMLSYVRIYSAQESILSETDKPIIIFMLYQLINWQPINDQYQKDILFCQNI